MGQSWKLEGEPADKISTEDKIILSYEEGLWDTPPEWKELAPEERLLLSLDIENMIPPEQLTEEIQEAILETIKETEKRLCGPR